jgi:hypothetical protein
MVTYHDVSLYQQTYGNDTHVYSVYMMHRYIHEHRSEVSRETISIRKFRKWTMNPIWGNPNTMVSRKRWSIRAILDFPENPDFQYDRGAMMRADLRFPIIVALTIFDTYVVMDGNHRLAKSIANERETIDAYIFADRDLMRKFKIGATNARTYARARDMTKHDYDQLYDQRFRS